MPFRTEAYPQGFPEFAVRVVEGPNVTATEHAQALAIAAEEAGRKFKEEYPTEKFGAAIVFACHEDFLGANAPRPVQSPDVAL